MKRYPVTFLVLTLLLINLAGCGIQNTGESTPTPIPAPTTVSKPTYTVQRGEVASRLSFRGQVTATSETQLYFGTTGKVKEILVEAGDVVTTGQVLATLDMGDVEKELTSSRTELDKLEKDYQLAIQKAELSLQIAKLTLKLYKQENRTALEIQIQELQVELTQIGLDEIKNNPNIQSLRDRVAELEASIAKSKLISPIDSRVLLTLVTLGREIDENTPILSLGDPNLLEVRADLNEDELKALREGIPVQVKLERDATQVISGTIQLLPPPYGNGPDNRVHISLDPQATPAEIGFQLNFLVSVEALLESHRNVLWLPSQAITRIGDKTFVILVQGDIQKRQDVQLGIIGEDRVEILGGLSEGQVIVGP